MKKAAPKKQAEEKRDVQVKFWTNRREKKVFEDAARKSGTIAVQLVEVGIVDLSRTDYGPILVQSATVELEITLAARVNYLAPFGCR